MRESDFFNAQNYEENRSMTQMLPGNKPQLKREDAVNFLAELKSSYPINLVGVRGYFEKTMGDPSKNDRGMYDDAMFIVSPDHFSPWNANTDPSRYQPGIAVLKANAKRNPDGSISVLRPEPYLYKVGLHGVSGPAPYEAFRQYGRVTVIRDGKGEETDTEKNPFFIDIHRGGYTTTSSLGCQTIHPDQWHEFFKTGKTEMKKLGQIIIPYWLVEF